MHQSCATVLPALRKVEDSWHQLCPTGGNCRNCTPSLERAEIAMLSNSYWYTVTLHFFVHIADVPSLQISPGCCFSVQESPRKAHCPLLTAVGRITNKEQHKYRTLFGHPIKTKQWGICTWQVLNAPVRQFQNEVRSSQTTHQKLCRQD